MAAIFDQFVELHQVGMNDFGKRPKFALEHSQFRRFRAVEELKRESDFPFAVEGLEYRPKSSGSEFPNHLKPGIASKFGMTYGLAGRDDVCGNGRTVFKEFREPVMLPHHFHYRGEQKLVPAALLLHESLRSSGDNSNAWPNTSF